MVECLSDFTIHLDKIEGYVDKLEIEENEFLKNVH